jgi:phage tail-like protein
VFNFVVEINGTQTAGFSEVAGLEARTETEDFREGGVNDYVHKIAKETRYSNLTLKHGITDDEVMWNWCDSVRNGRVERKTISVLLMDSQRHEKWRWIFRDAFPVKWNATDLSGSGNSIVIESIEFAHHGMSKL